MLSTSSGIPPSVPGLLRALCEPHPLAIRTSQNRSSALHSQPKVVVIEEELRGVWRIQRLVRHWCLQFRMTCSSLCYFALDVLFLSRIYFCSLGISCFETPI